MIRVVAIDGPSGAGKSTVARGVADALGLSVLDTGAMYRALTLAVLDRGVTPGDEDACAAIAAAVVIDVGERVLLDGSDVTTDIRSPEVTATVSTVSAHPQVRHELVMRQRAWIEAHDGGVVEGRDIGTVVFPDAAVKVFLTASDQERVRRRHRDEVRSERDVAIGDVSESLARRDRLDSTRSTSPLTQAEDALVLDTTAMQPTAAVAKIVAHAASAWKGAR